MMRSDNEEGNTMQEVGKQGEMLKKEVCVPN